MEINGDLMKDFLKKLKLVETTLQRQILIYL